MRHKDELDKIFKNKIEKSAFQYDDSYWEEAKLLIEKKPARRFAWWWYSSIVIIIFSVGYHFINTSNRQFSTDLINNRNNISGIETTDKIASNKTKTDAINKIELANRNLNDELLITKTDKINNSDSKNQNFKNKKSNNYLAVSDSKVKNISTNNILTKNINQKQESLIISNYQDVVNTTIENSINNNNYIDPIINNENPETNSNSSIQSKEEILASFKNKIDFNKSDSNEIINSDANKIDTTTENLDSAFKKINPFIRKQSLNIEIGMNLNKGINATEKNKLNVGALPYFAINYCQAIDKQNKLFIEGGLQFCANAKTKATTTIHHYNNYSFGYAPYDSAASIAANQPIVIPYSDSTFILKQNTLYFIQLPISLSYSISNHHQIHTGIGLSYLLNINSNIKNFDETTVNEFGYKDGFNPISAFMQIGYRYTINNKISLSLNYQQGLTDITKNSFFTLNRYNSSTHIQAGLRYEFNLTNKKKLYVSK